MYLAVVTIIGIVATLAIDAIVRAPFAIERKQVYSQRNAQSATANGAKYYLVKKYCGHIIDRYMSGYS